jgi:hypothetical protein
LGVYQEIVDRDTLTALVNADEPRFPSDDDGRQQQNKWHTDMKRLNAMLQFGVDTEDGALVLRNECYKKYGLGRRIVVFPSLQACPKIHRGPLAHRYVHDLDVENAHYSMMRQIAVAHGTTLSCVDYYCNHTQECRRIVQDFYGCSKVAAKQLFLSLLNGGDVPAWMYTFKISQRLQTTLRDGHMDHPGIVQQLRTEYAAIQRILFAKYRGQVDLLTDQIKRDKPQKRRRFCTRSRCMLDAEEAHAFDMRIRRSAFSTLLQEEEDRVLLAVEGALKRLGRDVCCPIFDGCLVRRVAEGSLGDDVIQACERAIVEQTGYQLKLWEKCLLCGEKLHECTCARV